ncbi:MAG TPA: hypothetical protein VGK88_12410 [bacterium]|jgi:hypothetical protein
MPDGLRAWSPTERRLIALITRCIDPVWGECYSTAQRAALVAAELGSESHRLAYCEGFASLPSLPAPFAHAWCLLNGQVWDPTPWFRGKTEYYGSEIPTNLLQRAVARRRAWGPVMLSPLPETVSIGA